MVCLYNHLTVAYITDPKFGSITLRVLLKNCNYPLEEDPAATVVITGALDSLYLVAYERPQIIKYSKKRMFAAAAELLYVKYHFSIIYA